MAGVYKLKTIIKGVTHFWVVLIYSFPLFASQAQQLNTQFRTEKLQSISLQVDTFVDSNEPVYQVGSDAPNDCSQEKGI